MRCWARTIREAAISSMARVVFIVDWMLRIRRLRMRSWLPATGLAARRLLGLGAPVARGARRSVAAARPLATLVGDLHTGARIEAGLEVGDGLVEGLLVGQRALLPDLLQHARLVAAQEGDELLLEPPDGWHRNVVEGAVGAGVDGHHLLLDGNGRVEGLLEDLGQPVAPVELGLGDLVELGPEGGERLQLPELGQVEAE